MENEVEKVPDYRDVLVCCKARYVVYEGEVKSLFPPWVWRSWIALRSALDPAYGKRIRSALVYLRDHDYMGAEA